MTYNVPWACINNPPAHGLFGSLIIYNFYCLLKQSKWNEINKIIFLLNFYLFIIKYVISVQSLMNGKRTLSSPLTCLAGIFPSQIKRGPNSEYKQGIQMSSPIPHPRSDNSGFEVTALAWPKQLGWKTGFEHHFSSERWLPKAEMLLGVREYFLQVSQWIF